MCIYLIISFQNFKLRFWFILGTLGLVDYDEVEVNNLHRQLLHNEKSIGHTKTKSAKDALLRFAFAIILKLLIIS